MNLVGPRKFGNFGYVIKSCLGYFRKFLMRLVIRKKKFKGVLSKIKMAPYKNSLKPDL